MVITGGGIASIADLLQEPGASRSLLEAVVPYSPQAIDQWLGRKPESYCSEETARLLAMQAFCRSLELSGEDASANSVAPDPVASTGSCDTKPLNIGLACTASLASDRPKRGDHRAHIALQTPYATHYLNFTLAKEARSRHEEDLLTGDLTLLLLAETLDTGETPKTCIDDFIASLTADDRLERKSAAMPSGCDRLLLGELSGVCIRPDEPTNVLAEIPLKNIDSGIAANGVKPSALLPGSFNPIHHGHLAMLRTAREMLGDEVAIELSLRNVDKPPIDAIELEKRLMAMPAAPNLWLTNLPTFEEKSAHFPGTIFLVGADTIRRIADPVYYGGDIKLRLDSIQRIADHGCRFLVFGRLGHNGFESLADIDLPRQLLDICIEVPGDKFREDVSSTELRRQNEK